MNATISETKDTLELYLLLEEFVAMLRSGQPVTVREFAARHPKFSHNIIADFPALLMAEGLKPASLSVTGNSAHSKLKPQPGTLAGYQVVRQIGRGGMGVVYEVEHPELSRRLAMKILLDGKGGSTLPERFRREAEAASKLSHPHVVPVFDFGEQCNTQYLVMPLIEGVNLDQLLEVHRAAEKSTADTRPIAGMDTDVPNGSPSHSHARKPDAPATGLIGANADFKALARLGADVASALAHAHEHNTIHRDIKPGNLILDTTGRIWVTDFGLAKVRDDEGDLSRTGDVIGTPRFMAPEQMRGLYDERSDVYSLGVTLYEMASGTRAWDAMSAAQLIRIRATAELPELADQAPFVPKPLADVIMKACSFRPEDRYQSAKELQTVLNRFAHGQKTGDRRRRSRSDGSIFHRKRTVAGLLVLIPMLTLITMYMCSVGPWTDEKATQEAMIAMVQDESQREKVVEELPDIIEAAITSNDRNVRDQAADLTLKVLEEAMKKSATDPVDRERALSGITKVTNEYRKNGFQYDKMDHPLTNAVRNLDLARQISALDGNGLTKVTYQVRVASFGELIRRDLMTSQQINVLLSLLPAEAQNGPTARKVELSALLKFLHVTNHVFAEAKAKIEKDVRFQRAMAGLPEIQNSSGTPIGKKLKIPKDLKISDALKKKIKQAVDAKR